MAEKKITKREYYGELKAIVEAADVETKEDILAFIDHQVELIDAKAAKAKERKAEKKAVGDELRETVQGFLTDEFQTGEDILAQIETEGVTKAKVTARLTQLVNAGIAVKEVVKVGDRRLAAYRLAIDTNVIDVTGE